MSHGTLYDHPGLYDHVRGANPTAEAFYSQEAHQRGTCVLELACGSSRFSIAMAKSGLNVVGGDLSSAMLERARAKAESAGVHIPLIPLDMRDFSLPAGGFNFVLIAANSVSAARRASRAVSAHSRAGSVVHKKTWRKRKQ
jgi:2-polyprenyl-3-methyl-5-hydroxy-6-metoxy-1,4-benzoquinol methylase